MNQVTAAVVESVKSAILFSFHSFFLHSAREMYFPHFRTDSTMAYVSSSNTCHRRSPEFSTLWYTSISMVVFAVISSGTTSSAFDLLTRNRPAPMPVSAASPMITRQCSSSSRSTGSYIFLGWLRIRSRSSTIAASHS